VNGISGMLGTQLDGIVSQALTTSPTEVNAFDLTDRLLKRDLIG
jgi:hypothetical protein